jgi:hypothetical protein
LLCVSVPVLFVFGLYFWSNRNDRKSGTEGTRFLGTQMDVAILILGVVLLLSLATLVRESFFG